MCINSFSISQTHDDIKALTLKRSIVIRTIRHNNGNRSKDGKLPRVDIWKLIVDRFPAIEQFDETSALRDRFDDNPGAFLADQDLLARQLKFRWNAYCLAAVVAEELRFIAADADFQGCHGSSFPPTYLYIGSWICENRPCRLL